MLPLCRTPGRCPCDASRVSGDPARSSRRVPGMLCKSQVCLRQADSGTLEGAGTGAIRGQVKVVTQPFVLRWRKMIASERGPASPTTRHVLLTLSVYMDQNGDCFPSTRELARATGLSERAVCTHLEIACNAGWIDRQLAGSGQAWKRMTYQATLPDALKDVQHEGTGGGSAPSAEGTERHSEGTERHDKKVLKEVQSNSSVNSPKNSPGSECSFSSDETEPTLGPAKGSSAVPSANGNGNSTVRKKRPEYSQEFVEAWQSLPRRLGSNSKAAASAAFEARRKEGYDPQEMVDGAKRYAHYCDVTIEQGREQFIMQASRFFGPGRHWENEWSLPERSKRELHYPAPVHD